MPHYLVAIYLPDGYDGSSSRTGPQPHPLRFQFRNHHLPS